MHRNKFIKMTLGTMGTLLVLDKFGNNPVASRNLDVGAAPKNSLPKHPLVTLEQMALLVNGRDDVTFDLTGDLSTLKDNPVVFKEGAEYQIQLTFQVQNEIVSGLRYSHFVYRKGLNVDRQSYLVGSYSPKPESQIYTSPIDEVRKGLAYRGTYVFESRLMDTYGNPVLFWEWAIDVQRDWA